MSGFLAVPSRETPPTQLSAVVVSGDPKLVTIVESKFLAGETGCPTLPFWSKGKLAQRVADSGYAVVTAQ